MTANVDKQTSAAEIKDQISVKVNEFKKLLIQRRTTKKPHMIRFVRKEIARLKTRLRQLEN